MIRRRAVLILSVLFGGVILILAYGGIESNRRNMLRLLQQEGESLMQSLVTSARNNLASSTIVEAAAGERLIDVSRLLAGLLNESISAVDSLASWQKQYRLEQIDLVNNDCQIIASSSPHAVRDLAGGVEAKLAVLDSVVTESRSLAIATPMPSALPREDYAYLALRTKRGIMLVTAKAKKLTDYQESLGIGFVVRQLGDQPGISYVVLQSPEGIVLASRAIERMAAIETDTFLTDALQSDQSVNRIYEFEGRQVLEVARAFKSDVMPSGVLRLGLSLDAYEELSSGSLKQLGILSLVLFILGLVGSFAATSLKRLQVAEVNLEALQSVTDEIVQSLEAAVIAVDSGGKITIFNPQAERIFGRAAAEVRGMSYEEVFPDDLLSLRSIEQKRAEAFRGETRFSRSSAETCHLLISSVPIRGSSAVYTGAVALVYDVTENRRLQENARTAERLSELGSLAAGVAHEIRNPLNAISIATQRLSLEFQPTANDAEYQAFLATIAQEIDRLNTIIKDFLSLSRRTHIEKVLVDLTSYFSDIVSLARLETEKQQIAIDIRIEPGLSVKMDGQEMKKVFLNLIRNATQAIGTDGAIHIKAESRSSGEVVIDVSNTGQPVPREVREEIWQPYFTTRKDGTGLGLAICRRIVADHGGTIELLEGEPTTFRIVV